MRRNHPQIEIFKKNPQKNVYLNGNGDIFNELCFLM